MNEMRTKRLCERLTLDFAFMMYAGLPSSYQWSLAKGQEERPPPVTKRVSSKSLLQNIETPLNSKYVGSNILSSVVPTTHPISDQSSLSATSLADPFLRLNVGGSTFSLRSATIRSRAKGFLFWFSSMDHQGRLQQSDGYFDTTKEYFFERSPLLFVPIYQFYATGLLHRPIGACTEEFIAELDYWHIPQSTIAECCADILMEISGDVKDSSEAKVKKNEFDGLKYARQRRAVWDMIENPTSSTCAQGFAACSISFVLLSITGLVLGSIPELQVSSSLSSTKPDDNGTHLLEKEPHPLFAQVEYVCIAWFTIEYLLKMLVAADRWKTFMRALNVVDLMAIVPFYIELSLAIIGFDTEKLRNLKGALLVIRILRVLRVVRIFKLGRYSSGLQTFAKTLSASLKQLGMMAVVMLTGVVFFSTLVYFLEKDEPDTHFYSIPAAFWWAMVTMTTVGYGDLVPVTIGGKMVASAAIACGVLVLALPITIIVDNFMKVSDHDEHALGRRSRFIGHPYMMKSATSSLRRMSLANDLATSQLTRPRASVRKSVQIEEPSKNDHSHVRDE